MANSNLNKTTKPYDVLGISSATICLIHCIVFPLFTLIPFSFANDAVVDTLFACIGMVVVLKILKSDASTKIKLILGFSMLLVIINVAVEILFDFHTGLLYLGGLGMIVGHIMNFKAHRHYSH